MRFAIQGMGLLGLLFGLALTAFVGVSAGAVSVPRVPHCICIAVYTYRIIEGPCFSDRCAPPRVHLRRPRLPTIAPPVIVCEPDPVDGHDPCADDRETDKRSPV